MHNARHARLQTCTSFIRIAKTADKSILPHMKVHSLNTNCWKIIISWLCQINGNDLLFYLNETIIYRGTHLYMKL